MESTAEASYESALREKEAGNACFASNPDLALERYVRALKLLGGEDSVVVATADANALACKVHTNAAAAALKIGDVAGAMDHCKLALAIDARNVKALFRMAEGLKRSGSYREAYAYLERALLVEENNEDIKEAMDECEDLLEFQEGSSDDLIVDDDEDLLAGSPGAEAELPDEVREAALLKIEELREDVLGNVREHVMLSHGSNAFGRIDIVDAFKSSGNLASALKFVRSQHFSSTAQFALIIVRKRDMNYPNVWWAHPWPFEDREKDGIFVEAHTREAHATWFIPLEGPEDAPVPQREVLLHRECVLLLDETVFP